MRFVLEVHDGQIVLDADGSQNTFNSKAPGPWTHVQLVQPDPTEREYQVDGSDVTSRKDRDADEIRAMEASPLYRVAAWLRDEASYSRWDNVKLTDLSDGRVVATGREAVEAAALPVAFRLEADLHRPEALSQIDLRTDQPPYHGVFEISRDRRSITWSIGEKGSDQVAHWLFPEQPAPFAAELLQLLGRAAIAGYGLLLIAWAAGWLLSRISSRRGPSAASASAGPGKAAQGGIVAGLSIAWLVAASWVMIRLYHQLPHIVDAAAYYFETSVFRSGHLWLDPPPSVNYLKSYFETVMDGRWFAQYPPGAPAIYALGGVAGLAWLMGPLCGLVLILATASAARKLHGPPTGWIALGLGLLSPFIVFQSSSFMSHPVAGAALACALAAFACAERSGRLRWYAVSGALLGWGVLTRELSTVLFGAPLVVWLLAKRRWPGLGLLVAAGIPFVLAYLAYDAQLTGDPFLLPRNAVNPSDVYGFGFTNSADTHHTLAAGLSNADENLTLMQFDLFGWPPLFAFSLLCLPFLLGKARGYDWLAAGALLLYIAGYLGVPGHGIVLGPRYYYEALPWVLLLASRGVQGLIACLQDLRLPRSAAYGGVLVVLGLLSLSTLLFYDPHLVERRTDYFAMDNNRGVAVPFVTNTLFGPRLTGFDGPTLVLIPNEIVFKTLAAMNCPDLDHEHAQQCQVLFFDSGTDHADELMRSYPGRTVLVANLVNNVVTLQPFVPKNS
ncbi:MAG: glycosyltransferase family 39 protein [Chloroflexi bacterium]|nr:glycosyltransferase family 39 protein [Chloroflexota bacterium]